MSSTLFNLANSFKVAEATFSAFNSGLAGIKDNPANAKTFPLPNKDGSIFNLALVTSNDSGKVKDCNKPCSGICSWGAKLMFFLASSDRHNTN